MGFGGISIWQLLIILAIVVLIFGTKKLRGMGGDLGGAIKNFKTAMNDPKDGDKTTEKLTDESETSGETIDVTAVDADKKEKTDA